MPKMFTVCLPVSGVAAVVIVAMTTVIRDVTVASKPS